MQKVIKDGHIVPILDQIRTIYFFSVSKGDEDIRLVQNRTSRGLNSIIWSLKFSHLPRNWLIGPYQITPTRKI